MNDNSISEALVFSIPFLIYIIYIYGDHAIAFFLRFSGVAIPRRRR